VDWINQTLGQLNPLDRLRRALRTSEPLFILLALGVGMLAGASTVVQSGVAHQLQQWLYGIPADTRLSASTHIPTPRLLALPLGGVILGLIAWLLRDNRRPMVDAVEANALHGGRMSIRDSLVVSTQTLVSNGFGGSVGLEAAYVQIGSGLGSLVGRVLHVRRADLRTLVGAGSGAAIAAAFGAPLAGAFYAFEIVMGAYSPAALAPVAVAALAAVSIAGMLGAEPYLLPVATAVHAGGRAYLATLILAAGCAMIGVALMRLVAGTEQFIGKLRIPPWLRPVLGGALLVPLAAWTPQILSSGHGAMSADLSIGYPLDFVAWLFVAKCLAAIISLGFGFRGGLFFASLFLGSLLGDLYGGLLAYTGHPVLGQADASLLGMAALSVTIVGGPLTTAMLVLETTHDFGLTSLAIAAALLCNTLVRTTFGYSFSTWRLHLRGKGVRSPRDIGWTHTMTAGTLMRRETRATPAETPIAEFRRRFPLGSASRVVLVGADDRYAGIVHPVAAHAEGVDATAPVSILATQCDRVLHEDTGVVEAMRAFDAAHADELAVVDADRHVRGIVSEAHVRRRYAEELERSQRELYGERT